jgi:hypothetical protein
MLPDLEALLAGYALYAKQNHFAPDWDEARLADGLDEAGALAGGHEPDEPAALFFALARRPRIFGKAHGRMTLNLAVEHARVLGLVLTTDVAVLELMRARILRKAIEFDELRDWFAAHLVVAPRKPWPPSSS